MYTCQFDPTAVAELSMRGLSAMTAKKRVAWGAAYDREVKATYVELLQLLATVAAP